MSSVAASQKRFVTWRGQLKADNKKEESLRWKQPSKSTTSTEIVSLEKTSQTSKRNKIPAREERNYSRIESQLFCLFLPQGGNISTFELCGLKRIWDTDIKTSNVRKERIKRILCYEASVKEKARRIIVERRGEGTPHRLWNGEETATSSGNFATAKNATTKKKTSGRCF